MNESRSPLLIADGDIPTTQLLARILQRAYGSVEIRYPENLFGVETGQRLVVISRVCLPSLSWLPRYLTRKGIEYLYFLDDNFWELTEAVDAKLASYFSHPAVIGTLDEYIGQSRAVVVMSHRLGAAIQARIPGTQIEYLNPPFDCELADSLISTRARSDVGDSNLIRIGYPTSPRPSVAALLDAVVRRVAEIYPSRVTFEFVGWIPETLCDVSAATLYPFIADYASYLAFKIGRHWDIGMAPLLSGPFESCKTSIKYREFGGCLVPAIYSRVPPYTDDIVNGSTGILVENSVDAWVAAIQQLVESPALRAKIALAAKADVDANYSQEASVHRWHQIAK